MKMGIRRAALAVLISSPLVLAACGGSSTPSGGASSGSQSSSASAAPPCKPAPAGTKVTLTYTSWVPGAQKVIDLWNKENPDIQVDYREVPTGSGGSYKNYLNAIKAGRVDDLGFVEFEFLPTFRVQNGLQDIGNCPGAEQAASKFVPWAWNQATFGEKGSVYALPHDTAAMAYFYRKDLYDKYGLEPAKTWDQFYANAKKIKAHGGNIANVSAFGPGFFPGLTWQTHGVWFKNNGSDWNVSIENPNTTKVADYWQKFIDQNLVTKYDLLSDEYNKAVSDSQMWGMIGASWTAKYIEVAAPKLSGDWRVAPLPQWTPDSPADGNWGGGNLFVFKGSKHPAEAAKFALWLTTSPEAQELNVTNGGIFPATVNAVQNVPALQQGTKYLGGQQQWKLFDELNSTIPQSWVWGPTQLQVQQDLQDGLASALSNREPLTNVFSTLQTKTVAAMKDQAIPVSG
jgi:multiple sugar transport system substrate-binding protein